MGWIMGSVMDNTDATSQNDAILPKTESLHDGYTSSSASTPEADVGPVTQDVVQVQKRKGGRKPIYATSEERKQRNRQAQAAFRERRTEYIKQLENTIKHHEETLQNLQQSHRSAADECLMLRYKNSLLERVLLEKGIDVQAELRMKSSPHLGPTKPPAPTNHSPMQRAVINRHQAARSNSASGIPPLQPVNTMASGPPPTSFQHHAPFGRNTSQTNSPATTRSPAYAMQSGMSSPTSAYVNQPMHSQRSHHGHRGSFSQHSSGAGSGGSMATPPGPIQERGYDGQEEMLDDAPGDDGGQEHYIPNFRLPNVSMSTSGQPVPAGSHMIESGGEGFHHNGQQQYPADYDPMIDADPFGLSASMHFPTPYAYDSQQPRR